MSNRRIDTEIPLPDLTLTACNLIREGEGQNNGALCYVSSWTGGDGVRLWTRCHGDKWSERWYPKKRITNCRDKTIPPDHPLAKHLRNMGRVRPLDVKL